MTVVAALVVVAGIDGGAGTEASGDGGPGDGLVLTVAMPVAMMAVLVATGVHLGGCLLDPKIEKNDREP